MRAPQTPGPNPLPDPRWVRHLSRRTRGRHRFSPIARPGDRWAGQAAAPAQRMRLPESLAHHGLREGPRHHVAANGRRPHRALRRAELRRLLRHHAVQQLGPVEAHQERRGPPCGPPKRRGHVHQSHERQPRSDRPQLGSSGHAEGERWSNRTCRTSGACGTSGISGTSRPLPGRAAAGKDTPRPVRRRWYHIERRHPAGFDHIWLHVGSALAAAPVSLSRRGPPRRRGNVGWPSPGRRVERARWRRGW